MEHAIDQEIIETTFQFEVDGVAIPAAVTLPKHGIVTWCVVIIPGSFFNDLDGNYATSDYNPFAMRPNTYADLARQLARQGHAVLRYARAGQVVVDPAQAAAPQVFAQRAVVVAQACRVLRDRVPQARACALAGHSEGSVVALLLLAHHTDRAIDAFISLSGPAYRFFDLMIRQMEPQVQDDGMLTFPFSDFRFTFAAFQRSLELVRAGEPIPDDLQQQLPPFGVHAMDTDSQRYLREYDAALDPAQAIAAITCPVLIVQGGQDNSVSPENGERLYAARHGHPAGTAQTFLPELNHFYKPVPPGLPAMPAAMLEGATDERVSQAINTWLCQLI
jgi:hypothetical protein